jgi:hypothetical protein
MIQDITHVIALEHPAFVTMSLQNTIAYFISFPKILLCSIIMEFLDDRSTREAPGWPAAHRKYARCNRIACGPQTPLHSFCHKWTNGSNYFASYPEGRKKKEDGEKKIDVLNSH